MRLSLPKIRTNVKNAGSPAPGTYALAAHQMATALGIPLEDAEGWVDAAIRRQTGVRE